MASSATKGVPDGCVGRLPRDREFTSVEEFSAELRCALARQSAVRVERAAAAADAPLCAMPDLQYRDVAADYFFAEFARKGVPCVLRGCAAEMGLDLSTWSAAGLCAAFPEYPLQTRTCGSATARVDYDALKTVETTLAEYCSAAVAGAAGSSSGGRMLYGANNMIHPELLKHIVLPDLGFPRHVFRMLDTRLWIGMPGTGARYHQDLQDNIVIQLDGRKEFKLAPPHDPRHAGQAWHVTPWLVSSGYSGAQENNRSELSTVLQPGDLLFVPAGWWHSTRNLKHRKPVAAASESSSHSAEHDDISVSINMFMSACFASLGVIVPEIADSDWIVEPRMHAR